MAFVVACYVGVFFWFKLMLKPQIISDASGLVVVNYLKTHSYRWTQIAGFEVGDGQRGVIVLLSDGTSLIANGVQKAPIMWLTSRPARADQIVEELEAERRRYAKG